MIELLSNCARGREIFTYHVKGREGEFLRKVSVTAPGSTLLEKEIAGWKWYESRLGTTGTGSSCHLKRHKECLTLDIGWIEGKKGEFYQGLAANREWVRQAVEHYCRVWPAEAGSGAPLHGDFSLDNLIRNSSGVHIIDWEHFSPDGGCVGFDAVYLLFETLWFGMGERINLEDNEKKIVIETLQTLDKNRRLAEPFRAAPLKNLRAFIRSHEIFWGEQLRVTPCKLPVLNFTETQTDDIDNAIQRMLRH